MRKTITLLVGMSVLFSGCGLTFSSDEDFQARISKLREQNDIIRQDIERKRSDYDYFISERYKDKYAKAFMDKMNEGETVVIIEYDKNDERAMQEVEVYELYEKNLEDFAEHKVTMKTSLTELGLTVLEDNYDFRSREYHVKLDAGFSIWFNLMSSIDLQLHKLKTAWEAGELKAMKEYIDLRVPGKVIYK